MAPMDSKTYSDSRSPDTFADLRSASHARQRVRKHHRHSRNSRSPSRADTHTHPSEPSHSLPPVPQLGLYEAHAEPQRFNPTHHHRPRKRRCNHNKRTWAKALGRKADAHLTYVQYREEMERMFGCIDVRRDEEWVEDITHRAWEGGNWSEWCLQQGATWEDVWGWEPWVEIGETFGAWARRRIGEMRAVKEARLRAATLRNTGLVDMAIAMEKATALTTTQPTTPSDIEAHDLLARVLHPPWRRKTDTLPRAIHGYGFFAEYEWYWHRNMSGCFELTSWVSHSPSYWRCYCDMYAACGRWSPEDRVQPYYLYEFFVSPRGEVGELRDDGAEMAEVYGEMDRLQRGLSEFLNGYKAVCDEAEACDVVDGTTDCEKREGSDRGGAYDTSRVVDEWDFVTTPTPPSLSTPSSSWSMLGHEEHSQSDKVDTP
ncbi:hypothetical protein P171DRAFT_448293 [Karstenula rhodostoma CBS 690.94]|uniref:Uncharacterized protein n=1 Tax=Karstenula rhodostoma CBS 690.94 TaxID=1392251 RepID=A0A9P4P8R9_9PLEO|nr:hypothetical protein P171DRAFT_448293 [Karstenula rhodostoma CBS 690.94]